MVLCPMIGSIIGMVVGALFIIAGLLAYFLIPEAVDKALRDRLSVTSKDSENYDAFVNARDGEEDGAGSFVSYTLFNLTNPDEVLAGQAIAHYTPVGPYRYRRRTHRTEVTFPDDGNQAKYFAQDEYTFEPLPDSPYQSDQVGEIYSMNPFAVGLVQQAREAGINSVLFSSIVGESFKGSIGDWARTPTYKANDLPSFAGVIAQAKAQNFITAEVNDDGVFSVVADPEKFARFRGACAQNLSAAAFQGLYGASWNLNFAEDVRTTVCTQLSTVYYTAVSSGIMDKLRGVNGFKTLAIRKHSPRGILFDIDPVSMTIKREVSLFQNDTSRDKFYSRTVLTGKNDTKYANMGMFVEYDNISHINSYPKKYPMRFRVTTVDAFQDSVPDTAEFYYPLIERPFPAKKDHEVEVKGITTHQYVVDRAALTKVDPDFDNDLEGVVNLAPVKSGVPFYACSPYYDLAEQWRTKVEGVVKPKDYDVNSRVDIEPRTGLGIKGSLRVMVLIKHNYTAFPEIDELPQGQQDSVVLHPIALLEQDQELSDAQADKLRKAVKDSDTAATAIMAALCSFGGILIIIFFTCFIVVCVRPKEERPGNKE